MQQHSSPFKFYTPDIREPLPLRRKPYELPAPPEAPEKPQKIDWLRTLLPPFIMMVVLGIVASVMRAGSFFVYTMIMMVIYPIARVLAYAFQKSMYDKKEKEREIRYTAELDRAESEISTYIRKQRELLKGEFVPTDRVCALAEAQGMNRKLWHRTNVAVDFMALRVGVFDGMPSFPILIPRGDHIDPKDPLLVNAHKLKTKYQVVKQIPYLLRLKDLGSVAILGEEKLRYELAQRLLLDVLVHHRPDEVEVYVLSNRRKAELLWGWLRWAPHCKVFDTEREFDHLVFGNQALNVFLARLENYVSQVPRHEHLIFVIDVDGIQQFDDDFVNALNTKAQEWNISMLFVGGSQLPRSVHGILKPKDRGTCVFVDTKIEVKDKEEKEYHTVIEMDDLPEIKDCERVTRSLAGIKLLSSSSDMLLSPNTSLFDVLGLSKDAKLTFEDVMKRWGNGNEQKTQAFQESDLLQFPIGLVEENSKLCPYSLNLLEAKYGGKDAYHTMLIGTTGSGKSEFIKSLILGAAYKYPPQYLNFFCMDFKGGSTVDQLSGLPHMVGIMTNLEEVSAQRGLIAVRYEVDRRQEEFKKHEVSDIWAYNTGRAVDKRMPHLLIIIDEFTRGLEMLNDSEFNLQDLLEKRLVPQGRSLGIHLLLANQVANAKAMKLLPNVGWRIALRVTSKDQMQFIESGLKPPKYAGRGYIQATGDDPIEFQSGYSGVYVQYSNMIIKPENATIKELLPNGHIRVLKEAGESGQTGNEFAKFLQMNQVLEAVGVAQNRMAIPKSPQIYLPPLKPDINLKSCGFDDTAYREFSHGGWAKDVRSEKFLQVSIGLADLVQKCTQQPLILDLCKNNPHLLIVGSQTDVIDGLRSVFFGLSLSHSPDDIQIYMLEFGKGLRELPTYPHIGDLIADKETEKIARCIEFFESEFSRREQEFLSHTAQNKAKFPHLFLVLNNIAGLKDNVDLYTRVLRFIVQESDKYGIHLILTALPRGTGTRVQSADLKNIKSRIVFPSINHEDYWHYLDIPERKLVKLTEMDNSLHENDADIVISRAYWLCTSDPLFDVPVEIQLALPRYRDETDDVFAKYMNKAKGYKHPAQIKILEKKYSLEQSSSGNLPDNMLPVGIRWLDLQEFSVPVNHLPSIWGVSGPRESGKTNFLTMLVSQLKPKMGRGEIDVFSVFPNELTDYCAANNYSAVIEPDDVMERLKQIEAEDFDQKMHLIVLDDLHLYWERETATNKAIIATLEKLTNKFYGKQNLMLVAAFNYSLPLKTAKSRDAFVRHIHDNKTGLCLAYEGDWVISSTDLANYKKKLSDVPPPGRGVFVLKGKETEIQSFWYRSE